MTPTIGTDYIGPHGRTFTVLAIEGTVDEMQWVVIRGTDPGCGTIRFPIWDSAKWLTERSPA